MGNITKHRYEGGDREGWLALRESMPDRIGGSELGSIAGHNQYCGFLRLLEERVGLREAPDLSDKIPVWLGQKNEENVAEWFCKMSGKKVHVENCIYTNDRFPHLKASIDRKISNEESGLECKTSFNGAMRHFKRGDFPMSYYDQCCLYLAVTELRRWYLAILTGNSFHTFLMTREKAEEERYYELFRKFSVKEDESDPDWKEWCEKWAWIEAVYYLDDGEIEACEIKAKHFCDCIEQVNAYMADKTFENEQERLTHLQACIYQVVEPSDIDGSDETKSALNELSPEAEKDSLVVLDPASPNGREINMLLDERASLNAEADRIENRIGEIDNIIALRMATTETATIQSTDDTLANGITGWKVTYKNSTPRRTASVNAIEDYFANLKQEVPEGLISVGESKRSIRVYAQTPKSSKPKKKAAK